MTDGTLPRTGPDRPRPRPSVLLPGVSIGLTLACGVWFALGLLGPWQPPLIAWIPVPAAGLLAAVACRRAATAPGTDPATRRFWNRFVAASVFLVAATITNGYDALAGPVPSQELSPATAMLYLASVGAGLWALLRLPFGRRSGHEWLTLGLDATTVMAGVGLFIWHFSTGPIEKQQDAAAALWILLAMLIMESVLVLAVAKVVLAGAGPVNPRALRTLGLCTLTSCVAGSMIPPLLMSRPYLSSTTLVVPFTCMGLAWAAHQQHEAAELPATRKSRRGRRFSVLPYLAVASTDALFLATRHESGSDVIAFGAVALTALVVARQIAAFQDNTRLVTRLDASLLELSRHERRFRSLVQHSSDIIIITDINATLTYASPGFERVTGRALDQWLGRSMLDLVHPEDLPVAERQAAQLAAEPNGTSTYQIRVQHADGSSRWLDVTSTNLLDEESVGGIVSNVRDVSETRQFQDRLAYQASHDSLTLLANRALFSERVSLALAAAGPGRPITVALIDLDDFKAINDRLGHAVGDEVLVVVAERLRRCVRSTDTVARLGGDEFAVLLRDVNAEDGRRIAEDIAKALAQPISSGDHTLLVHASIGLADSDSSASDEAELLRRADVAMYAAKDGGKGRHARYAAEMDVRAVAHEQLAAELREAVALGQLYLVYQPIVTLPDGRPAEFEALVRWRHPEHGLISPAEFIPIAERTGAIVPVGGWILREACRHAATWQRRYGDRTPAGVSVNVSARQLREPGFADDVAAALREAALDAQRLTVEVTETAVFDNDLALATLRELHALGVRLALDDFGTGHSSLGLLRTCPVDVVKVDKSFVDDVAGTPQQAAIATSIIQIARTMGLVAVAEGVETAAQADRLHQLGYRLAQGFHFFAPLPADEVELMLAMADETPLVS